MIGRSLFSYFFWRYLSTLGQFLIGVCLIAYLVDFTEFSRFKSGLPGFSVTVALLISALRVPMILQTAIPFIVLFAAMAALIALNRRYELVIARAAGVSAWQFLMPLCVASLVVGLLAVTVLNTIAARALAYSQELEAGFQEAGMARSDASRTPWLRQKLVDGSLVIGAHQTARNGLLLTGALFLRVDADGNISERIDAERAVLEAGKWRMENATRYRPSEDSEKFATYEMDSTLRPEYIAEQIAAPDTVPFFELPRKIAAARSLGLSGNQYSMQFNSLIALPLLLVAMTLIAATVSMRFVRMGQSATMILGGFVAGFLLYVVSVLAKSFGAAGFVPPVVAAWSPVVVAMFFGVTFLLYKEDG